MEKENRTTRAIAILTMGNKYLHLTKNILEENIKSGQVPIRVYSNYDPTIEKMKEDEKWSFRIIIIPMLFNLYHGIELTMKGFLVASNRNPGHTHCLTKLLDDFKGDYQGEDKIIQFLEKYIKIDSMPPYLMKWFLKYELSIDDWYKFLKYPFDKQFEKDYDYFDLKYDLDEANKGINLSESMCHDIKSFLPETVKLYRTHWEETTEQKP